MSATKETEWERRTRRARERAEHVEAHGPACQICGNVPKRGLDQDHDHRTGKTRGWLCHRCNRALPTWVTPLWLVKAALYLLRNEDSTAGMIVARHDLRAVVDYLEART
jgi:hypothetical protein